MNTNPFFADGKRRAIDGEIRAALQRAINATPVVGCAQLLDLGEGVANSDRIAGFAELGGERKL